MKKLLSILVILGVLTAAAFAAYAAWAKKQPTFEIYGEEVLTTTASADIVARARYDVSHSLGNWIKGADGTISNPTFHESGRSWTRTRGHHDKSHTSGVGRGMTEFTDAKGNHIVIEIISGDDMPTFVFFSPPSGDGTAPVLNAFTASLQKQGVKPILQ